MFLATIETMICAQCRKESPFTVRKYIDTGASPEMKEAVRDGSVFCFTCPFCGAQQDADYGFMYDQREDHLMIQYVSDQEDFKDALKEFSPGKQTMKKLKESHYTVRVVRSKEQFREKLTIFDAGLDDRIIELQKLAVTNKTSLAYPDIDSFDCFLVSRDGESEYKLVADSQVVTTVPFDAEIYHNLESGSIGKRVHDLFEDDVVIDHRWACDFFRPR